MVDKNNPSSLAPMFRQLLYPESQRICPLWPLINRPLNGAGHGIALLEPPPANVANDKPH
jgi:hypothetical protein